MSSDRGNLGVHLIRPYQKHYEEFNDTGNLYTICHQYYIIQTYYSYFTCGTLRNFVLVTIFYNGEHFDLTEVIDTTSKSVLTLEDIRTLRNIVISVTNGSF